MQADLAGKDYGQIHAYLLAAAGKGGESYSDLIQALLFAIIRGEGGGGGGGEQKVCTAKRNWPLNSHLISVF